MTLGELKDTKFYLGKCRMLICEKIDNEGGDEKDYKDIRRMTELIDEITDKIILKIRNDGGYK